MSSMPQPMPDLVVVIPGMLGSVLELDGREVWGLSGEVWINNLLNLGRNVRRLELPAGIGDEEPDDGVTATRLMPDLHLIPGLWGIDGYDRMLSFLRLRFELVEALPGRPGNLLLFPYDWRLSNVVSAQRLQRTAVSELERWRQASGNREARLILVCHSMGGLVARWFLEVLGGRELTRMLITIGTPFQGSVDLLSILVNGVSPGLGPLRFDFSRLIRSCPTNFQLLPTYPCLDTGDGELRRLTEVPLPNLGAREVAAAARFHETMADSVGDPGQYETVVIKGGLQPTAQTALLADGRIQTRNQYRGTDYGGDGRVARPSSHPPEWESERGAIFATQKHASLQNTDSVLHQIFGVLTQPLGQWPEFVGGAQISLEVPELIREGDPLPIRVRAQGRNDEPALQAIATGEDGRRHPPQLMTHQGEGLYQASLEGLPPGAYRVTVGSADLQRPVDSVTDLTLVWG